MGGQSSVHIERVRVGRTVFRSVAFDAAELASQDDLERRIAELADPDLVLAVSIAGIAPDSLEILPEEVERRLSGVVPAAARQRSLRGRAAGRSGPAARHRGRPLHRSTSASRLREAEARGDDPAAEQARQVLRLGRRLLLDDPDHVTLA